MTKTKERLPILGKSLFSSYCYILLQAFFTLHYSLSIECKVSFEGTVVIWLVKA